jgi:translation initiation factor IF-2
LSKLRVQEMAGEFGISADEVIALLRQMDVPVRGQTTVLNDDQVARVRARWEREKRARAERQTASTTAPRRRRGAAAAEPAPPPPPAPAEPAGAVRRRRRVDVPAAIDAELTVEPSTGLPLVEASESLSGAAEAPAEVSRRPAELEPSEPRRQDPGIDITPVERAAAATVAAPGDGT